MGDGVYANLLVSEGTITTATIITLNLRARRITITNDSATQDLSFKFNNAETYATLKPTETVSMKVLTKTIYLNGSNVPYRIWGVG